MDGARRGSHSDSRHSPPQRGHSRSRSRSRSDRQSSDRRASRRERRHDRSRSRSRGRGHARADRRRSSRNRSRSRSRRRRHDSPSPPHAGARAARSTSQLAGVGGGGGGGGGAGGGRPASSASPPESRSGSSVSRSRSHSRSGSRTSSGSRSGSGSSSMSPSRSRSGSRSRSRSRSRSPLPATGLVGRPSHSDDIAAAAASAAAAGRRHRAAAAGSGSGSAAAGGGPRTPRDDEDDPDDEVSQIRRKALQLPIYDAEERIRATVRAHQVVVIVGETGSGKTTQLPQMLFKDLAGAAQQPGRAHHRGGGGGGRGLIGITQPRRVAAVTVASRVAKEMRSSVGDVVGYQIRFDDHSSPRTRVKFMTDGVLVREVLRDPQLRDYSLVVLDEAHERSLSTDILFGLMKALLKRRPDLKLIVASATLNTRRFAAFFNDCPIIEVPGRTHDVQLFHTRTHYRNRGTTLEAAVDIVMKIHRLEQPGHVLVFLTGQDEIEKACEQISERARVAGPGKDGMVLAVVPLYGSLKGDEQRRAFDPVPPHVRKVVVCTNIAETSVTVDGVRYVVDPGFVKQRVYRPDRGMDALVVVPISQTAAQQRAGRAGRTSAGKCYRIYPKETYAGFERDTVPEIQRCNLATTVLELKILGVRDVLGFDFLDPPLPEASFDALRLLHALEALDADGAVTPQGRVMALFPVEPCLARMLVAGVEFGCLEDALTIAAMLSSEEVWYSPRRKKGGSASHQRGSGGGGGGGGGGGSGGRGGGGNDRFDEQTQKALRARQRLSHPDGDHLSFLAVYNEWVRRGATMEWCLANFVNMRAMRLARNIRKQLKEIVQDRRFQQYLASQGKTGSGGSGSGGAGGGGDAGLFQFRAKSKNIRKAICSGFFMHAARNCQQATYRTVDYGDGGANHDMKICQLHPNCTLPTAPAPPCVVYMELIVTAKPFLRNVVAVVERWVKKHVKRVGRPDVYRLTSRSAPVAPVTAGVTPRPGGDEGQQQQQQQQQQAQEGGARKKTATNLRGQTAMRGGPQAISASSNPQASSAVTISAGNRDAALAAARARFLARKKKH